MLFSDGRQRAARLASQLGNDIAMDEGRALFVYLHKLIGSNVCQNQIESCQKPTRICVFYLVK